MTDFGLGSIDWESVRLLHGEHLGHETAYVEELVRWVIHSGLAPGVVSMGPESLGMVQSSPETYRLALRSCRAITPAGHWVHIRDDDNNPTMELDKEQHLEQVVGIHLGVDTTGKEARDHAPSMSSALIECKSRWPRYQLSKDPASDDMDWLQIGQIINRGGELVLDKGYIPDCLQLRSHPMLANAARAIAEIGNEGLTALGRYTPSAVPDTVTLQAAGFACALAPAATLVDWAAGPQAYIDRLSAVLTGSAALARLCPPNTGYRDDAIAACETALGYVQENADGGVPLGPGLLKISQALETLVQLYGQLVAAPAKERAAPAPKPADRDERIFRRID